MQFLYNLYVLSVLYSVYLSQSVQWNLNLNPGGGGHSTSQLDRGCRWGAQNLTLSYCARRTKNTPCHNIPY